MQLIKKLSSKSIMGAVKKIAMSTFFLENDIEKSNPEAPSQIAMYKLYGICNGIKTGESDNGEWVSFEGDFKAVRVDNNEEFRAPRAFISEPAAGMMRAALEENDSIELAFEVSIVPATNAYGYEYRTNPIFEVAESQPLLDLEKRIQLRLDAPKDAQIGKEKTAKKKAAKK